MCSCGRNSTSTTSDGSARRISLSVSCVKTLTSPVTAALQSCGHASPHTNRAATVRQITVQVSQRARMASRSAIESVQIRQALRVEHMLGPARLEVVIVPIEQGLLSRLHVRHPHLIRPPVLALVQAIALKGQNFQQGILAVVVLHPPWPIFTLVHPDDLPCVA